MLKDIIELYIYIYIYREREREYVKTIIRVNNIT